MARPLAERLEPRRRSLTPAESRLLGAKARDARARSSSGGKVVVVGMLAVAVLWLLTLLASDAPWPIVTGFWLVVGGGIVLWVQRDSVKASAHVRLMADRLDSALRFGLADAYDVRAQRFAELEEFEDEGACYAFDIGNDRLVFVVGQEFYPEARFPSHDFSIVYPLDEEEIPVDVWVEKRGERAEPDMVVPARVKWNLEIPEHLTVLHAPLDRLADMLTEDDR